MLDPLGSRRIPWCVRQNFAHVYRFEYFDKNEGQPLQVGLHSFKWQREFEMETT